MNIKRYVLRFLWSCFLFSAIQIVQVVQASFFHATHLYNPTTNKHVYFFGDYHLYPDQTRFHAVREQATKQQNDIIYWAHEKNATVLDEDIRHIPTLIRYCNVYENLLSRFLTRRFNAVSPLINLVQKCTESSITAYNIDHRLGALAILKNLPLTGFLYTGLWIIPNIIKACKTNNLRALFFVDQKRLVISGFIIMPLVFIPLTYFLYKKQSVWNKARQLPDANIIQTLETVSKSNYENLFLEKLYQKQYLKHPKMVLCSEQEEQNRKNQLFRKAREFASNYWRLQLKRISPFNSLSLPDIEIVTHLLSPQAPNTCFVSAGACHCQNVEELLRGKGYDVVYSFDPDLLEQLKDPRRIASTTFVDVDTFMQDDLALQQQPSLRTMLEAEQKCFKLANELEKLKKIRTGSTLLESVTVQQWHRLQEKFEQLKREIQQLLNPESQVDFMPHLQLNPRLLQKWHYINQKLQNLLLCTNEELQQLQRRNQHHVIHKHDQPVQNQRPNQINTTMQQQKNEKQQETYFQTN